MTDPTHSSTPARGAVSRDPKQEYFATIFGLMDAQFGMRGAQPDDDATRDHGERDISRPAGITTDDVVAAFSRRLGFDVGDDGSEAGVGRFNSLVYAAATPATVRDLCNWELQHRNGHVGTSGAKSSQESDLEKCTQILDDLLAYAEQLERGITGGDGRRAITLSPPQIPVFRENLLRRLERSDLSQDRVAILDKWLLTQRTFDQAIAAIAKVQALKQNGTK